MTTEQQREMALQLAWLVRETSKHGGISPDALEAAEQIIHVGGGAPSNSIIRSMLSVAELELFRGPEDEPLSRN